MIQNYKHHSIEIKQSNTTSYTYMIKGHFFPNISTKSYKSGFKNEDEALTSAKNAIDLKFEAEEEKASYRRYLVEQDYEYFLKYLEHKKIPSEQVPIIASTLVLASNQKEISTEQLQIKIGGSVNVSGSVDTSS